MPSVGDFVIGTIVDIGPTGWLVDINCPYLATLPLSEIPRKVDARKMDLSRIYNIGDVVRAKIAAFSSTKGPILTTKGSGLGKAVRGRFIKVMPTRIPRIIGRKGSMIELLKKELECRITIGQNGVILLSGKNRKEECLALSAIRKIEAEAHTKGLTNRVSQYIKARKEKYG
jgi:exosome complex component RRP4